MEKDFDVILVGGGGAGLASVVAAADCGAKVLIVEAGDAVGGSTALSTGVFYAAGTSVQRAIGIVERPPVFSRQNPLQWLFFRAVHRRHISFDRVRAGRYRCRLSGSASHNGLLRFQRKAPNVDNIHRGSRDHFGQSYP